MELGDCVNWVRLSLVTLQEAPFTAAEGLTVERASVTI